MQYALGYHPDHQKYIIEQGSSWKQDSYNFVSVSPVKRLDDWISQNRAIFLGSSCAVVTLLIAGVVVLGVYFGTLKTPAVKQTETQECNDDLTGDYNALHTETKRAPWGAICGCVVGIIVFGVVAALVLWRFCCRSNSDSHHVSSPLGKLKIEFSTESSGISNNTDSLVATEESHCCNHNYCQSRCDIPNTSHIFFSCSHYDIPATLHHTIHISL
jgi:hypothetical protein